jgi:hypothetical protein
VVAGLLDRPLDLGELLVLDPDLFLGDPNSSSAVANSSKAAGSSAAPSTACEARCWKRAPRTRVACNSCAIAS